MSASVTMLASLGACPAGAYRPGKGGHRDAGIIQSWTWSDRPFLRAPAAGPRSSRTRAERRVGARYSGRVRHSVTYRRSAPLSGSPLLAGRREANAGTSRGADPTRSVQVGLLEPHGRFGSVDAWQAAPGA